MAGVLLLYRRLPWDASMTDPHEFLKSWVRDRVQETPYRNKAEARRLTYECRKAADRAGANWFAVIKAAGGDVEGYVMTRLNRAADHEAGRG